MAQTKKISYVVPENSSLKAKATNLATVIGQFLKSSTSAGTVVDAAAADTKLEYIAQATITAGQALASVPVMKVRVGDIFAIDSHANSDVAHNEQRMVLKTSTTIDNTGTDASAGVVKQIGVIGAAADKRIIVEVIQAA